MGIKDLFRRGGADDTESAPQRAPERDDEPGSVSSQLDVEGRGPVTLDERTKPGGQASPDTNQGKAEPMPAGPGEPDPNAPLAPPDLDSMNIGAGDPQLPSAPAAGDRDVPLAGGTLYAGPVNPGAAPDQERPGLDPSSTTTRPEGPQAPGQATPGRAQRQPGSHGESPEEQETDVAAGAARMQPGRPPASSAAPVPQPGDSQGVPVPSALPAPGTSEESSIVHGVRAAVVPGEQPHAPAVDGTHPDGTVDRPAAGRDAAGRDAAGRDAAGRDATGRDATGRDAAGRDALSRETPGRTTPGGGP